MLQCTYCGDYADSLDHVTPKTLKADKSKSKENVVPCCMNCNVLLNDVPIFTIPDRAAFLYEKIKRKYRKKLVFKNWPKDELDEVSEEMVRLVKSACAERDNLNLRLKYLKRVSASKMTIEAAWY